MVDDRNPNGEVRMGQTEESRIRARNELHERGLKELVYRDDLTGLLNRRFLRKHLNAQDWDPQTGTPLSILMLDVDRFKSINDNYGHTAGDKALIDLSSCLTNLFAGVGIVTRYAGDEFVVVLAGKGKREAVELAEKARKKVKEINLAVSIGVASFPADASTPDELIDAADTALYAAKNAGRDRVSTLEEVALDLASKADVMRMFPCPKLINREAIMRALMMNLPTRSTPPRKAIILTGESGIGKTRLLTEAGRAATREGILTVVTVCEAAMTTMAYDVLTDILHQLIETIPDALSEACGELPPEEAAAVDEAIGVDLPLKTGEENTSKLTPDRKKATIFNGLCRILSRLSARKPLLIVLDRIHFCDEATLAVLSYLLRDPNAAIAVYGSMPPRSDSSVQWEELPINSWFSEEEGERVYEEVPVGKLEKNDILRMIHTILRGKVSAADFDEVLFRLSAGNPLNLEEVLKFLIGQEIIVRREGQWVVREIEEEETPTSLEEAIKRHLGMLDAETSEAMAGAAVIGSRFDIDTLKKLIGRNEGYTQELLDRARKAAVIISTRVGDREQHQFAAEKIHEVAYDGIADEKRKTLHRRAGAIEEQKHRDNPAIAAGRIAFHYSRAGENEKADHYRQLALARSRSIFAPPVALARKRKKPTIKEAETPLDDAAMRHVRSLLRFLCAAIKNRWLYPEGSQLIVSATKSLYSCLKEIFKTAEVITLCEAEHVLLINGSPLNPREFGANVPELLRIFDRHNMRSLTVARGVSLEEMERFLSVFNLPDADYTQADFWVNQLEERGVVNIAVDQRVYVMAGEEEGAPTIAVETAAAEAAPPRARETEKAPARPATAPAPVAPPSERPAAAPPSGELPDMLEDAIVRGDSRALNQLIRRLCDGLRHPNDNVRAETVRTVLDSLGKSAIIGSEECRRRIAAELSDCLSREESPEIADALMRGLTDLVPALIQEDDLDAAKRLLHSLVERAKTKPAGASLNDCMRSLSARGTIHLLVGKLSSQDAAQRSAAKSLLADMGAEAARDLVELIKRCDRPEERFAACAVLKEAVPEAADLLGSELTPVTPPAVAKSLIQAIRSLTDDVYRYLAPLLSHTDEEVVEETVNTILDRPAQNLLETARSLLAHPNPVVVRCAVRRVARDNLISLWEHLAHLLENHPDEGVQSECCVALGRLGMLGAVPYLCRALESGFLGILRKKPSAVRAAAAWALGHFNVSESIEALQKAAGDRDSQVRAAAITALKILTAGSS